MMKDKLKEKYLEYLDGVYINHNPVNTASVLLFKEYLKRLRVWYERLGLINGWFLIYRFDENLNVINLIAPELLDEDLSYNEFLTSINTPQIGRWLNYPLIYSYLCFELLKDHPKLADFKDLSNPYEPVIKIFQRGNDVRRGEMKTFEVNGQTIFRDIDFSKTYLPCYDNKFLDYIDKKCERLSDFGIPNSKKVNKLLQEFQQLNS